LRVIATASLAYLVFVLGGCGGSSSSSSSAKQGPLAGNWQITLTQEIPAQNPIVQLSVSGFLLESNNSVTGSLALPGDGTTFNCAGVGPVTGTVSGQNVAMSVDEGGSTLSLTGAVSSDSKVMAGTYQTLPGGCTKTPTSGTWAAFQIPPLNGNFSGNLTGSSYMASFTGKKTADPIPVTGTMAQSSNIGASNATLTGTINATGYPCFTTASVTGTISGSNVILSVFGFDGSQIGTLGTSSNPAVASSGPNGAMLTSSNTTNALILRVGASGTTFLGPCPPLNVGASTFENDSTQVAFTFQ
jgi:hypothetical protein